MKIVNISGGLGNQMFQYAFAVALKQKHVDECVKIDTQHYKFPIVKKYKGINFYHNGFEINKVFPNADIPVAKFCDLVKLSYYLPNYILFRIARRILPARKTELVHTSKEYFKFDEAALNSKESMYYEGVWESFHYYEHAREMLRHVYAPPAPNGYNAKMLKELQECESVGIHVRRGDYNSDPEFGGICDEDYYQRAIKEILADGKRHIFYVFSNDLKWCKETLETWVGDSKVVYVTENRGDNSCWDMFLMRCCQDLIIANSSFSWWGAFLNTRNGRVVAPRKWVNRDCDVDIWDPKWIRL